MWLILKIRLVVDSQVILNMVKARIFWYSQLHINGKVALIMSAHINGIIIENVNNTG